MIHHCPKCNPHYDPHATAAKKPLVYQPAKLRFWCPICFRNFTLHEVAVIQGGQSL